jgi:hypothetical protein
MSQDQLPFYKYLISYHCMTLHSEIRVPNGHVNLRVLIWTIMITIHAHSVVFEKEGNKLRRSLQVPD